MPVKKESKNLGITQPCPSCQDVIIRFVNFSGTGTFEMRCPHCMENVSIEFAQLSRVLAKRLIPIAVCVAIAAIASLLGIGHSLVSAEKAKCSVFSSQSDAQAHYQKSLDRNHDGIACNDLPR